MSEAGSLWRRCSNCKNDIAFLQTYWVCSVSTCNRKRTGLVFCTTSCWDAHLPLMRHREAWALEERAPSREAHVRAERDEASKAAAKAAPKPAAQSTPAQNVPAQSGERREPRRIRVGEPRSEPIGRDDFPRDILIVASKLKKYVKERYDMNTSDGVMEVLSDKLRELCDDAIGKARADERKTLMNRDF